MGLKSWIRSIVSEEPVRPTTDAPSPDRGLPEVQATPPMPPVVEPPKPKKPRKPRAKKQESVKQEVPEWPTSAPVHPDKAIATAKGEPWVSVTSFALDMDNLNDGSFEIDWNDIFVAKLVRAGYKGKSDVEIVDQWFQDICRNVVTEGFEQYIADPTNRGNA